MDIISRLLGCDGLAADAVSAYTQDKWKMHRRHSKFQSQNVQFFGYVYQSINGQNHGTEWKTQSFLLSEICTVSFGRTVVGKAIRESSIKTRLGKKFRIGNADLLTEKKDYSCL